MQKGSNRFDDIFKNKLQGLSPESNPGDWIMMERLLEMEGLTQEHELTDESRLDEVVLDKLSSLPTGAFIPDWDKMSNMIDQMNEDPSMDSSEFDQAIDNKIKETQVPLDMATWGRIAPILAQDREALVDGMDEVAKEKLSSTSDIAPSWSTMNSKINRELFLPESIVKYKIIEVALILLFALSAAQFPIRELTNTATSTRIDTRNQGAESGAALSDNSILENTVDPEPQVDVTSELARTSDATLLEQISKNIREVAVIESSQEPFEDVQSIATESIWDLPQTIVDDLKDKAMKPAFKFTNQAYHYIFKPQNIEGYDASMAFLSFYDLEMLENVFGSDTKAAVTGHVQSMGILDYAEAPVLAQSITDNGPIALIPSAAYNSNSGLILSVFTGSDYNEIVTPFDPVYAKEGTQQWNVGYAGGLALGVRFKNWELETGAIYASNQYSPQKLYEINSGSVSAGYIAKTLRDIELEIVKIPLNFRFNVNLWDKWKVYALSGATMNMVVQSEFITDDIYIGKGSFTSPGSPSLAATDSGLSRKDFGEGILEGGSFRDNSYFTANLGLGVERTLNNKWSVFAQPTYQRQIFSSTIGPNQDRYNAISLFLGTRVALSKKVKKK